MKRLVWLAAGALVVAGVARALRRPAGYRADSPVVPSVGGDTWPPVPLKSDGTT